MRLIDADVVIDDLQRELEFAENERGLRGGLRIAVRHLKSAPTFDMPPLSQARWISMEERLPTEKDASPYGLILCVLANGDGHPSDEIRAWHWENIVSMQEGFTHWMSLPALPNVKEKTGD